MVQSVYSIEEEEAIQASLIASGSVSSVEELKVWQWKGSYICDLVLIFIFALPLMTGGQFAAEKKRKQCTLESHGTDWS